MSPSGAAPAAGAPESYCRTAAIAVQAAADVQAQDAGIADRFQVRAAADRAAFRGAGSAIALSGAPELEAGNSGNRDAELETASVAQTLASVLRSETADATQKPEGASLVVTECAIHCAAVTVVAAEANFDCAAAPPRASPSAPASVRHRPQLAEFAPSPSFLAPENSFLQTFLQSLRIRAHVVLHLHIIQQARR